MTETLLPCPFCGSSSIDIEQKSAFIGYLYFAWCQQCDARTATERTKEGASEHWNTRAQEYAIRIAEAIEELGCPHCRECDSFCPTLNGLGDPTA